jgi:hypothetical protein
MNEDIIKWAREAGFVVDEKAQQHQPNCIFHTYHMIDEPLARFAALIRADEREQCAKVCDGYADNSSHPMNFANNCAAAIRSKT